VRIQELKTRIKMALPSSYPHVQALTALATSIAMRALRPTAEAQGTALETNEIAPSRGRARRRRARGAPSLR
jgi:hypothetical protein